MNSAAPEDLAAMDKLMATPEGAEEAQEQAGEIAIPLKALAQPDDTDAMQTPEQGDNVTFTVDATVTRIDGEMAYVKPNSVNQTPVGEAADDGKLEPDEAEAAAPDTEADQLRNEAAGGMGY